MHIIVSSIGLVDVVCIYSNNINPIYPSYNSLKSILIQTKLFFNAEFHSNDFPIKMGHGGPLDKSATGVLGMSIHL